MPIRQTPAQKKTVKRVMHEFKHGELKTARSSRKVKNPKQAIAIALSEAGASRNDSPSERKHNLRRTKSNERRGETGQAAAEGRRSTPRKSAAAKSTGSRSTAKSTARKSTASKSTAGNTTARRKAASATVRSKAASGRTTRRSSTQRPSTAQKTSARRSTTQRQSTARKTTARRSTTQRRAAGGKTRAELYREAQRRNIPGRSRMNKAQLQRALRR